jgi:hypothetical protein
VTRRILTLLTGAALALVLAACPSGSTQEATEVTDTAATLNGSGNPKGVQTYYWFQYGKTTAYGSETPHRDGGSGTQTQNFSERVTGLSPGTTYHFRAVAQSSGEPPVYGADRSFATLAPLAASQPAFPIRGAFYYPWHPETSWPAPDRIYTRYQPSLGFYDSSSPELIRSHVRALEYGKVEVAISSWWGRGDRSDTRLPTMLSETSSVGSPLRWSIYYEPEGWKDPSVEEIRSDLTYLRDRYGSHPAFFRVNGRFVVFVWGGDGCAMAERWRQANTVGAYVVLKLFPGYRDCASQPDGWHQYSAAPETSHPPDSFTLSPGFWSWNESQPLVPRDLARFRQNVRNMVASGARFQLLISFNEWGEGTAAESAQEWASPSGYGDYLDALHDDGK